MSFDAMAWAMRTRAPTSAAKLLLLALADLVRPPAMKAFASASTLANMTQLDRKTILANLHRLESAQLIRRLEESAGKGGAPVFTLLMDELGGRPTEPENGTASPAAKPTQPVPDFPPTDTAFPANPSQISHEPVPKTGHISSIDPVKKPGTEPKKKSTRARKPVKTTIPDDFAISTRVTTWAAEKGHDRLDAHFEHFAGKARASGYTYVDWDQAFMNAIRDDWAELRKRSGKPASGAGKAFGARGLFEGTNYRQGLNGEDITDAEFRMTSE